MNIKTKFSIGDFVYYVQSSGQQALIRCPICFEHPSYVDIGGERFNCPKCLGRTEIFMPMIFKHRVFGPTAVGEVRARIQADFSAEIDYMLVATGIGSGTIHHEANLYATLERAEEAAEKLNLPKE